MKDKERKREVEGLLGGLADERFALLVNLGKKISDWGQDEKKESKHFLYVNSFSFMFNIMRLRLMLYLIATVCGVTKIMNIGSY